MNLQKICCFIESGSVSKFLQFIVYIGCVLIANSATANEKQNASKLYINSDDLVIDQVKQEAHFTGAVILWFEDMVVNTTELKVFYKKIGNKSVIDHIIMPVKLTAKKNITKELLIADSAQYFVDKKELTLIGNILIQTKDRIIKTNKLVYYMQLNKVDF